MKILSLCSGIGGIEIACEWAGMEIVGQVEIDPYCQKVLAKHWPNVKRMSDVKEVIGDEFGTVDLITAGIPCQPYSVAGKRRGAEDDRAIWPEIIRIIKLIKPKYVLIENVGGFVSMALDQVLSDLEGQGYEVQPFIIPACAVDAPHRRERVFIVAHTRSRGFGEQELCEEQQRGTQIIGTSQNSANRQPASVCEDVTDPDSNISDTRGAEPAGQQWATGATESSDDVADTGNPGLQGWENTRAIISQGKEPTNEQFNGRSNGTSNWAIEPNVGRVAHGVPARVDRLKGLGNAVVWQQIYPFLSAIAEIERSQHA